jgi:hypothetical protein
MSEGLRIAQRKEFPEKLMNCKRFAVGTSLIFVLAIVLGSALCACAQDAKGPYPSMAALDQYLMDRNAEIALARSAAPDAVSREANVLVLGPHGYETAVEGKNGFVCLVERAWTAPFNSPEFWNPKSRSPVCYNPASARSVLPLTKMRTELVLAGVPKEQIIEKLKVAEARKEIPPLEPGGMAYMMSKQAYLTDRGDHNLAHVMFWVPNTDAASWGANVPKSPIILLQQDPVAPITLFGIPVGAWSDGTPAPVN